MSTEPIPAPRELPNKPLVEAIFELRWKLKDAGSGMPPQDPGFRIALGRYYDQVRQEYPLMVDLPTAQVPEDMTAYAVRHQFRAGKDKWPVTQLGPGILTVNETAGYTWNTFRPRLLSAISAVFQAYPTEIAPFEPIGSQLRYIDAIPYDPTQSGPVRFLSDYLHTNIVVDPLLFDGPQQRDAPVRMSLNLTFPLSRPSGTGVLRFADGTRGDQPSIIMEIVIQSEGDHAPKNVDSFPAWLDDAHAVTDKWFFTLIRGPLLELFERTNGNANA